MPQYEFTCHKCGCDFTKTLSIAEYDKKKRAMKCPGCGSKRTERRWTRFFAVGSKKS